MITWPWSKIEKVVPPPDGRPAIEDVYFDKEEGNLVATDGFVMAIVPVESEPQDTTGHIPLEAITAGRKQARKSRLYIEAHAERVKIVFNDGLDFPRSPLPYPDYKQIVPAYDPEDEEIACVTFDARCLMRLAEALCQAEDRAKKNSEHLGVTLTFHKDGVRPILVHPLWDNGRVRGRYGILMPMARHTQT